MNKNLKRWKKTKVNYINWLSNTPLRLIFSKSIKIDEFSLWWVTKLVDKNIMTDNKWYYQLNSVLNNEKIVLKKNFLLFFYFIIKLIKKIISNIIGVILVKFIYIKKNKNLSKINCFYSHEMNIIPFKKIYLDRQYGIATTKNKKKSCYLINFEHNPNIIFKFLKRKNKLSKLPLHYFILNKYVSLGDVLKVYFFTICLLVKLLYILRKKNYFIIKNKDCSLILKPLLIESFCGHIQNSLIHAIAIKNFFKKENYKNFITYGEFFSGWRSVYYFAKKNKFVPKIIYINHGIYSENNLSYVLKKDEFDKNDNGLFYSPKPDVFLTQGIRYFKRLKKIFPYKKVYPIGSFKYELANYKFNKPMVKKYLNKIKTIRNKKKIIAICTAINDETNIINFLNKCNLENFLIILCPHPYFVETSNLIFKKNFNYKFEIMKNFSTREIASAANCVVTGMSAVGLEFLIKGVNVLKVVDDLTTPLQEMDDGIPTISNYVKLNRYLQKKPYFSKSFLKQVKENFFYKFDNKTSVRFWKILDTI